MSTLLLFVGAAVAGPVHLDRVEILADESPWLVDEAPWLPARPGMAALRFVEQVQPVVAKDRLSLGVSWATQVVSYEHPLPHDLGVGLGLQTRLGLPSGATASVSWSRGPVRLGLGLSALTPATWADPRYTSVRVRPALGVAIRRTTPAAR